jgi:hypothetical protein
MDSKVEVTGRDQFIMCSALAYAIETIERQPDPYKEWSDQQDMILLLNALTEQPKFFRDNALWHISGHPVLSVVRR